ncbi:serine/arginine-rich splicing factor 7-like, partial [Ailuropoda melanoleuca]|uniref:serine/arginine-rich splicing factor 7-like n=1 Tax=Ailuropoda melanoleuca TaxID=9646 RepID=UPI001494B52E
EVARAFSYYGPLTSVWIARNPPGFAFVEFEDPRDAEDAVHGLDGKKVIAGSRVRVELSASRPRRPSFGRGGGGRGGGGFNPSDRCYECGERGHYAYDCDRLGSRRRSRSRSGGRRRSRSRSRSRGRRSPSPRRPRSSRRSKTRSRSRSPAPRRSTSRSRSRSPSRGSPARARPEAASKSRSRSPSPRK